MTISAKTQALKTAAEAAHAAHEAKKAEYVAQGMNSRAHYPLLKDLREAAVAAHAAYVASAKKGIHKELTKIINEGRADRKAAELARSPWKRAKAAAGIRV